MGSARVSGTNCHLHIHSCFNEAFPFPFSPTKRIGTLFQLPDGLWSRMLRNTHRGFRDGLWSRMLRNNHRGFRDGLWSRWFVIAIVCDRGGLWSQRVCDHDCLCPRWFVIVVVSVNSCPRWLVIAVVCDRSEFAEYYLVVSFWVSSRPRSNGYDLHVFEPHPEMCAFHVKRVCSFLNVGETATNVLGNGISRSISFKRIGSRHFTL